MTSLLQNSVRSLRFVHRNSLMDIKQRKQELRKHMKATLGNLTEEEIKSQSDAVSAEVLNLTAYKDARRVCIFLSMPGREISTTKIVLNALHNNKAVFVPYIHMDNSNPGEKIMDMLRLRDEADFQGLERDAWGIPSLSAGSIAARENALGGFGLLKGTSSQDTAGLDVVFMPSMAFDSSYNRLGHGKGFYDRYLSQLKDMVTESSGSMRMPRLVGLALREQILSRMDAIPVNESDFKVDAVICPN